MAQPSARRDTSRDGFGNKIWFWFLTNVKWFWNLVQAFPLLQGLANKTLITKAIEKAPGRPNPLSTRSDYASWASLTDLSFYGRHLPPAESRPQASVDDVAELFRRPSGGMRESQKSTALFGYFAQWFIDGLVRTDFALYPDRTLKNVSSHQVDLGTLYGHKELHTAALREGRGGRLKSQQLENRHGVREEFPPFYYQHDAAGNPVRDASGQLVPAFDASLMPLLPSGERVTDAQRASLFAFGGERANITPGYAMLNVLFLREHNRIAGVLQTANRTWDDERLFQTARNTLIVMLLKIVIEDYINHITPYHFKFTLSPGRRIKAAWHRPNWVSIEFNLLYRWHSLMPDHVDFVDTSVPAEHCEYRNDLLLDGGLARAFEGAARQKAGEIGLFNTPGPLLRRVEVPSIEMGRRARLRSYNDYREWCQIPRATSFDQISANPQVQDGLRKVYGHVDEIELFTGLFAEDVRPNSVLGPLMGRMVGIDAFSQALTNPLIADTVYRRETFSDAGFAMIQQTSTLNDVVARNVPGARPVSFTHRTFPPF